MFYHGPKLSRYDDDGFAFLYYPQTSANGIETGNDFIRVLKETRLKSTFNRAHEWCAGPGPLGFKLLKNNLVNHVVFTDISDHATISCAFTAMANQIEDKTTIYLTDHIEELPEFEVWDLIVANPPWWPEVPPGFDFNDDQMRMYIDWDWQLHAQLWNSVSTRLTVDGEIFLCEDVRYLDKLEPQIKKSGLKLRSVQRPFDDRWKYGCVLHLTW